MCQNYCVRTSLHEQESFDPLLPLGGPTAQRRVGRVTCWVIDGVYNGTFKSGSYHAIIKKRWSEKDTRALEG